MITFMGTCKYGRCYGFFGVWGGWGGVGWGGVMITFLELANVVDATQEVEWGGVG